MTSAELAPEVPAERTGHLDLVWRPTETGSWPTVVVDSPPRATMHVADLAGFPRDPERPDDIVIIGGARYLMGQSHPDRAFHRYLFRLTH